MTPSHFAKLFDYEFLCTELVLASLRGARRSVEDLGLASLAAPYERALAVFAHMQAARRLWLHRVAPDLSEFPSDGVFPIWPLDKVEVEARQADGLWRNFVARLKDREGGESPKLDALIRYSSTEGVWYESRLDDILTHVVNHSTYHRGQIASLVASAGAKPSVTDYIALTRNKV